MRSAMTQVREAFGADAVIMSNKKVTGGVEVVAAMDYELEADGRSQYSELSRTNQSSFDASMSNNTILAAPKEDALEAAHLKKSSTPAVSSNKPQRQPVDDATVDSLKALLERQSQRLKREEAAELENKPSPLPGGEAPNKNLPAWAKSLERNTKSSRPPLKPVSEHGSAINETVTQDLGQMKAEMKSLRSLLTHQVNTLMQDQKQRENPLCCMLEKHLIESQFSDVIAARLSEMAARYEPEVMIDQLPKLLANMISIQRDDIVRQGGVVALVGPTGVGKTTTLAKLAARYAAQQGADKLGLITTDHYRIGAFEQLATYGRIMGCAVKKATNEKELEQALYQLRTRHLVLIDTAGMSQRNMQLSQQLDNLMANPNLPIRSYLVMSGVAQRQVAMDIVNKFQRIPLSGCILTKLDEAIDIGGVLSVLIEQDIGLSYVTNGQRVPEDLNLVDPDALAQKALEMILAQKPKEKSVHWSHNLVEEY